METIHVFLDTEAFIRNNYQYDSEMFKKVAALARQGRLVVYLTTITISEVKAHIEQEANEGYLKIEGVKKRILKNIPDHPIQNVLENFDLDKAKAILHGQFVKFLEDTKAQIVEVSDVPIDEIMADYFACKPPFGEGKKKSEFPDAFALAALRKRCLDTDIKMYVISGDPDMDAAAKAIDTFTSIELEKILEKFTAQEKELSAYAINLFDSHATEIAQRIKEKANFILWPSEPHEQIVSAYTTSVDIRRKYLIDVSEERAVFEVLVNVRYTAQVRHYNMAFRMMGSWGAYENTEWKNTPAKAEVSFLFDINKPEEFQIENVTIKHHGDYLYYFDNFYPESVS